MYCMSIVEGDVSSAFIMEALCLSDGATYN